MGLDPNAIASSGAVALVLALVVVALFVRGDIVSGKRYDELMRSIDKVVGAIEKLAGASERNSDVMDAIIRERQER